MDILTVRGKKEKLDKNASKRILKRFKKVTNSDQAQMPKGFPIVANSVVLLALFITSLTGGALLNIPVQYLYALVFNWSITIFMFAGIALYFKSLTKKSQFLSFFIVFALSYIVYYGNCMWAYRVPVDNMVFVKAIGGFMLVWAVVNALFALFDLKKTGFGNFADKKTFPFAMFTLVVGIIIHHIYMWAVL